MRENGSEHGLSEPFRGHVPSQTRWASAGENDTALTIGGRGNSRDRDRDIDESVADEPSSDRLFSDEWILWEEHRLREEFGIVVRALRQEDIGQVRALDQQVFPVEYDERFYRMLLAGSCTGFGAFVESTNQLLGVATARLCIRRFGAFRIARCCYLMTLGVAPDQRRYGIGRILLAKVSVLFRDRHRAQMVHLHVHSENSGGLWFYRRCGFQAESLLRNYYTIQNQPADGVLMSRYIPAGSKSKGVHFAVNWMLGWCQSLVDQVRQLTCAAYEEDG